LPKKKWSQYIELPGLNSLEKSSSSANGKSSKQRSHLYGLHKQSQVLLLNQGTESTSSTWVDIVMNWNQTPH